MIKKSFLLNDTYVLLSIDILCLIFSPFLMAFFKSALKNESLVHLFWLIPMWISMIFGIELKNKTKEQIGLNKIIKISLSLFSIISILLFAGISLGLSNVFILMSQKNNVFNGFMLFFMIISLSFIYIYKLLSPFSKVTAKIVQISTTTKTHIIQLIINSLTNNLLSILMVAFIHFKMSKNLLNWDFIFNNRLLDSLILGIMFLLLFGSYRVIHLLKPFSLISLLSLLFFYVYIAWNLV